MLSERIKDAKVFLGRKLLLTCDPAEGLVEFCAVKERSAPATSEMTPLIRICQKCGTEIPGDAPEGDCPHCLLETVLEAEGGQVLFGRYTLVKVLGRGGMGIVWLARDEELERKIEQSLLRSGLTNLVT